MKKNILIAIAAAMLTAGTTVCHAQTQQKPQTAQQQEPVYEQDKVDKRAEFTGGMEKQTVVPAVSMAAAMAMRMFFFITLICF